MPELPLVGDEFAGYRMRSVLGRGGMSVVYQAENLRLSNVIALKVLAPELAANDVFRARFLEESRIAASLNHPNVIPIYDMGSSDELLYIAMRYVSGTDLRQIIKKRGRLQPETALFLLGQVARALDAAHRQGLVHRDVKPGNMLIERGSDEGDPDHVYLADFGITKHAMSRTGLTSTGQFLGTIDYVAPEQIRGTSVLGLADQYSLGCVLYECLTGRVPFEKDLDAAIIWAHVEETPTMPTVLRPDLPAGDRRRVRPGAVQAARWPVPELPRVHRCRPDGPGHLRARDGLPRLRGHDDRAGRQRAAWPSCGSAAGPLLLEQPARPRVRGRPRPAGRPRRRITIRAWPVLEQPAERRLSRPRAARSRVSPAAGPSPLTAVNTVPLGRASPVSPRARRLLASRGGRAGTGSHAGSPCWRPWSWCWRAWAPGPA